eukprot:scaffold25556_cov70-Phaeocystis_antarctica.AAC.7
MAPIGERAGSIHHFALARVLDVVPWQDRQKNDDLGHRDTEAVVYKLRVILEHQLPVCGVKRCRATFLLRAVHAHAHVHAHVHVHVVPLCISCTCCM